MTFLFLEYHIFEFFPCYPTNVFHVYLFMKSYLFLCQDTFREELLKRSLDVVYNCCKVPSNHIYYEEAKAVDALLKIREKTKGHQNEADITALLALGYLLDDSNNDQIISGQGKALYYYHQSHRNEEIFVFLGKAKFFRVPHYYTSCFMFHCISSLPTFFKIHDQYNVYNGFILVWKNII